MQPQRLGQAILSTYRDAVTCFYGTEVKRIEPIEQGVQLHAQTQRQAHTHCYDRVIIANAHPNALNLVLPSAALCRQAGQVALIPNHPYTPLKGALSYGGYAAAFSQQVLIGSSYRRHQNSAITVEDHHNNLQRLQAALGGQHP